MEHRAPIDRVPPTALVVAAIVCVQFGSAVARSWFDETGPLGATSLRLAFGAVLLLALVRPRVGAWTRNTWRGALILGAVLGGMNTCIYLAVDRIPFGVAVTIEFLGPLLVAVLQARRALDVGWAALALGGVALLGWQDRGIDAAGFVFAALAALSWAVYILASARLARDLAGLDGLAVAVTIAAVVVQPFGAPDAVRAVAADPRTILAVFAAIGLVTSAAPYAFEYVALRRLPTRTYGILASLGPALAALAGFVVLDQSLALVQLTAMVLVTVASIGVVRTKARRAALRVRLRPLDLEADIAAAVRWYGDPDVLAGSEGGGTAPYDEATVRRMYADLADGGAVFVVEVEEDGRWIVVGDAVLRPDTLPIVIGEPRFRGRGVGSAVLAQLVERAHLAGWPELHVRKVFADNEPSLRMFRAAGFDEIGRSQDDAGRTTVQLHRSLRG